MADLRIWFLVALCLVMIGLGYVAGRSQANSEWFQWIDDKLMPIVASCDSKSSL
ncbi:hypothetical protein F753_11795 [Stutzerimonas chloritidismutans AW-1]|uniref:Uncharacterized protein n=1 Tax=Stutzerimonas chloritidismutans AW-1 TaxID=1263865 RepID=V4PT22_STUCH|nr:hypothetical protein F753_11795 [Stutzerimonas chloritidismutans AW-1]